MKLFLEDSISSKDNQALMKIINEDNLLRKELKITKVYKTVDEFEEVGKNWELSNGGSTFPIVYDDTVIGVASLSSIDISTKSSNFGFWIKSDFWNTEIETSSFLLLREKATKMGISSFRKRSFDTIESRIINKSKMNNEMKI